MRQALPVVLVVHYSTMTMTMTARYLPHYVAAVVVRQVFPEVLMVHYSTTMMNARYLRYLFAAVVMSQTVLEVHYSLTTTVWYLP